ncbi:NXPE family member 4-like isoform X2 [Pecten maximus]|uniref:NXPE family member 4-like isoform X2 n=1 Tax=Pecten maximus TaxID=6579 RepID=UPI001458FCEE|nr:NXPE family member 4-like isoform X2 [Pecten maximus]XP_033761022.1 NXPE family member 4-like isoform X2 [Pecten maximus]
MEERKGHMVDVMTKLGRILFHVCIHSYLYSWDNKLNYTVYRPLPDIKPSQSKGFIDIDLSSIPDPKLSYVKRLNVGRIYTVGEHVSVKVILRDAYGRRLQNGGDVLRIWLVNYALGANVIGSVTYAGHGVYIGKVLLPWKGKAILLVSIAQTQQAIKSVMSAINEYGNVYEMYGLFSNEIDRYHGQTDKTLCSTVSNKRLGSNVCNLTAQNFGYSWFCGKPISLRCKDWKAVSGSLKTFLPEYIVNKTRKQHMVLENRVTIQINGDTDIMPRSGISCHDRPKLSTWSEKVPTGFYYKNTWNFANCRGQVKWTERSYIKCLSGRHLLIIGDSTTRQIVTYLTQELNLSFSP